MTTHHGNEGKVKLSNNAVGEIKNFTVEQSVDTADDTAMGDSWRTHKVGHKSWTASVECHFDPADTNGQAVLDIGASVTFNAYAIGDGSGAKYLSGTATVTGQSISTPMDDTVSVSFTLQGNGALAEATVGA